MTSFLFDGINGSDHVTQKKAHYNVSIFIYYGLWMKIFLHHLAHVLRYRIQKKYGAPMTHT